MPCYDLIVIGSGPAGEKGAAQAAYFGKRVALIEREPVLGGACVNTGTIPSKTLRESALHLSGFRQRGFTAAVDVTMKSVTIDDFMYRKQLVLEKEWTRIDDNLRRHHIDRIQGTARFLSPTRVGVKNALREQILERAIVRILLGELQNRLGVTLHLACEVQTIEKCDDKVAMTLRNGTCIVSDMVLYAAGRGGNVGDLNLEVIGVKTGNRGLLLVNE